MRNEKLAVNDRVALRVDVVASELATYSNLSGGRK
jgi:hypothetical protein